MIIVLPTETICHLDFIAQLLTVWETDQHLSSAVQSSCGTAGKSVFSTLLIVFFWGGGFSTCRRQLWGSLRFESAYSVKSFYVCYLLVEFCTPISILMQVWE